MSREKRRVAEKTAEQIRAEQQERKLTEHGTPQDVTSERAKSQRHRKSTADKWNQ